MTDTTPVPPMSATPVPKIDVRALNPLLDGLAKLTDAEATITRLENDISTLRAEVERLTGVANENAHAAVKIAELKELELAELRATVAEQGAALAERDKEASEQDEVWICQCTECTARRGRETKVEPIKQQEEI